MKKRIFIGLAAVLIVIIIVVSVMMPTKDSTTQFVTENVRFDSIDLLVSANGTINPENLYNINPRFSAQILEVNVKMGDVVTEGQQLAKLDDTDLQNALKSAQYNFNAAVYSRDQLKDAPIVDDYAVKRAQQQVNSAYVQVQSAKNNLNNAIVKSPISGKVLAVNIKAGEYTSLTAMQPAFIVGNSDVMHAYLDVNEIDITSVVVGQKVKLSIDAIGKSLEGEIVSIAESSTNTAGIITYSIQSSINDITNLKAGMSVDGDIVIEEKPDVLVIPAAAVQSKDGKNIVRLLSVDAEGVETVIEKNVDLGINNNTWVEVLSGLNEGESVIINYNVQVGSASSPFGLQ